MTPATTGTIQYCRPNIAGQVANESGLRMIRRGNESRARNAGIRMQRQASEETQRKARKEAQKRRGASLHGVKYRNTRGAQRLRVYVWPGSGGLLGQRHTQTRPVPGGARAICASDTGTGPPRKNAPASKSIALQRTPLTPTFAQAITQMSCEFGTRWC